MHANIKVFWHNKTAFFPPLCHWISLRSSIRMFKLNCFFTTWIFILIECEKMQPRGFVCTELVTLSQGEGQWMWYKMVEVNAYMQSRYEKKKKKNWLKNLHVMSNINVFAMQDGSLAGINQPTGQTGLVTCIHMLLVWIKTKHYWIWKCLISFLLNVARGVF